MISFSALLSKRNNSFCDKLRLKLFTQSTAFKSLEIQFQSLYPRYVNERCPYDRRQRGMCKRLHDRVVQVWIWERGTNTLARYFGTKSLRNLNTITVSLRRSLSLTVSQLRDLMPSEMWSSFLRPNTIRAAKICTKWSFTLPWEVFAYTVEQSNSLLKTKAFINNIRDFLPRGYFILLICINLNRQLEVVFAAWSL